VDRKVSLKNQTTKFVKRRLERFGLDSMSSFEVVQRTDMLKSIAFAIWHSRVMKSDSRRIELLNTAKLSLYFESWRQHYQSRVATSKIRRDNIARLFKTWRTRLDVILEARKRKRQMRFILVRWHYWTECQRRVKYFTARRWILAWITKLHFIQGLISCVNSNRCIRARVGCT
jgi:hypothetical protein